MLAEQRFSSSVMTNGATAVEAVALAEFNEQRAAAAAVTGAPAAVAGAQAVTETPQRRNRQPQRQLAQLDEVALMLNGLATADEAFQAAMAEAGLIAGYLAECTARYAAAEQAVTTRHQAMVEALQATEALEAADIQARATFSAFRQVARTVVKSSSGRAALKLDEQPPKARAGFLHMATTALTTAQGEPYATLLATTTQPRERVAATLALLDALDGVATAQAEAQHRALLATQARDAAMHELAKMARQIKVEVRTLLRCHPGLRAPVGF